MFCAYSESVGKVEAYMPYVGYVTIVMNDYRELFRHLRRLYRISLHIIITANLKYALLAIMGGGILL